MDFDFPKPEGAIKVLKEFEEKKKELNIYNSNESFRNFLEVNNSKYSISQSKIDLLLYNFEKNSIFNFSDRNKKEAFKLLQKGRLDYSFSPEKIYKLYLYFYGAISIEELEDILYKLSDKSIKKLDFRGFIEENASKLFSTYKFPQNLNGEYPLLKELLPRIKKDTNFLKKIEYWRENFLEYFDGEYETPFVKEMVNKLLKGIDERLYVFFKKNKKIKIKKIISREREINSKLYQEIKIILEENDAIVLWLRYEARKNYNLMNKNDKYFCYLSKNKEIDRVTFSRNNLFTSFSLMDNLKDVYPLNKIYYIKMRIKKLFSKEK